MLGMLFLTEKKSLFRAEDQMVAMVDGEEV
jgi:hypothetical protein